MSFLLDRSLPQERERGGPGAEAGPQRTCTEDGGPLELWCVGNSRERQAWPSLSPISSPHPAQPHGAGWFVLGAGTASGSHLNSQGGGDLQHSSVFVSSPWQCPVAGTSPLSMALCTPRAFPVPTPAPRTVSG